MPFWQFSREGRDGRALLVRPSRIPCWISKILSVLESFELLAIPEGKVKGLFFSGFTLVKNGVQYRIWTGESPDYNMTIDPNPISIFSHSGIMQCTMMRFLKFRWDISRNMVDVFKIQVNFVNLNPFKKSMMANKMPKCHFR